MSWQFPLSMPTSSVIFASIHSYSMLYPTAFATAKKEPVFHGLRLLQSTSKQYEVSGSPGTLAHGPVFEDRRALQKQVPKQAWPDLPRRTPAEYILSKSWIILLTWADAPARQHKASRLDVRFVSSLHLFQLIHGSLLAYPKVRHAPRSQL